MTVNYFTYTSILSSHHLPSRFTYSYLNLTGRGLVADVPLAERTVSLFSDRVFGPSVYCGSIETALDKIGSTFFFCLMKSPKPFFRSSSEYCDLNSVEASLYKSEKSSELMASANSAVVALIVALARLSSTSPPSLSLSLSPNTEPFDVEELLFDDEVFPKLKPFPHVQPSATSKTTDSAIAPLRRLSRPNNIELMKPFINILQIIRSIIFSTAQADFASFRLYVGIQSDSGRPFPLAKILFQRSQDIYPDSTRRACKGNCKTAVLAADVRQPYSGDGLSLPLTRSEMPRRRRARLLHRPGPTLQD